mgnify:CR=1 FL=1
MDFSLAPIMISYLCPLGYTPLSLIASGLKHISHIVEFSCLTKDIYFYNCSNKEQIT